LEVVIVDNNSTDGNKRVRVAPACQEDSRRFKYLLESRQEVDAFEIPDFAQRQAKSWFSPTKTAYPIRSGWPRLRWNRFRSSLSVLGGESNFIDKQDPQ